MKNFKKLCCVLFATATCVQVIAQTDAKDQKPSADQQAWMAYATPGPMHEMLAKSNGMWNEDVAFWMAPGTPPQKMTSTCMNRMIMGGRYLQGNTRGNFNGMPFEGTSTTAYDNAKKVFINTWIDNMGTGIMTVEGPYNETTKTVEMKGMMVDPMSGKEIAVRQTLKFVDDKNQVMEMYNTPNGGKEFKSMEIKFSKKEMDRQPMQMGGQGTRPMPPGQNPPTKQPPVKDDAPKPADKK